MNKLVRFQKRCTLTMLSGLFAAAGAVAQSGSFGSTHVASGGELTIHGAQTFTSAGMITTSRAATPGLVSFASTGSHSGASDAAHVDGYVRRYGSGAGLFTYPIGQSAKLRPAAVNGAGTYTTTAAYFLGNPTSSTLAAGGFPITSRAANVSVVSGVEYWDINGAEAVTISLTWDAASGINALVGGDLSKLRIVGWNTAAARWEAIPTAAPTGTASGTGVATSVAALAPNTYNVYTLALGAPEVLQLAAKVILSGAYVGGTTNRMRDDLRIGNLIPATQPYTSTLSSAFSYTGTETIGSGVLSSASVDNAIVDWVLVQLRTGGSAATATTIVAQRAGLVQRDGDIVDMDGVSPLSFTANAGQYYVAVRHRNHLGTMANVALNFNFGPTVVDFTDPNLITYGTSAQRALATGRRGLWQGNANANRTVIFQGNQNDPSRVSSVVAGPGPNFNAGTTVITAYSSADTNLNGAVIFQGPNNDLGLISSAVLGYQSQINLAGGNIAYIVGEQIP